MAAAEAGGGPAQAGQPRQPVLEIYTREGLAPYCMKPVNDGTTMFKGSDIMQPDGSVRVKIHSDIIAHGILWPVLGDPDIEFKQGTSDNTIPPDRTYSSPHVTNDRFQYVMVYDNHPMLGYLISQYQKSKGNWTEKQKELETFCKEIRDMTYVESSEFKPDGQFWPTPEKRNNLSQLSPAVYKRVNLILRSAAAAAKDEMNKEVPEEDEMNKEVPEDQMTPSNSQGEVAAQTKPGGSRRRRRHRPSRKYKKSKRVLRRKSRSTRRR